MAGGGAGEVRWNKETQSWEPVGAADGHRAPPPPPEGPVAHPGTAAGADGSAGGAPGEWPPPAPPEWPQPPPSPPGAPGGRRGQVIVVAVVAAVAGSALAAWLAVRGPGDDGDDKAGGPPSSTAATSVDSRTPPSDPTTGVDEPTYGAASESPDVPAGHRLVEDPSGFTTVVPEDWSRSERDGGAVVFYTAPDKSGLLQIFEVVEPGFTPAEALDVADDSLSGQPGFTEISRGPVADETDASELVYEYDSKDLGERVRAVDRVFRTDDGRLYAMVVRGTTDDWPATQETLRNARQAFTPS
ncbi:hypothetical protein [Streptomyces sp. NPDC003514]